ncbi:MAG: chorismate mutase [Caulobacter sp.]|nr:chorismate mutase [Caulobacter sp.]
MGRETPDEPLSLEAVRARIDAIDAQLLPLLDERAAMAHAVAAAKRAAGGDGAFGLRPAREAMLLRKLLDEPRTGASAGLVVRVWREMIGESLALQGPFSLAVWGGRDPGRTVELARLRFGSAPSLFQVGRPEDAIAQARMLGGVGVLALSGDSNWWGRLLAEPKVKVFAALPCLNSWGAMGAFAVGDVPVEPTGADQTFWVTDATQPGYTISDLLSRDGVAGRQIAEHGGLKLFVLTGFYQEGDERLKRAPGSLTGVIGAAPEAFEG